MRKLFYCLLLIACCNNSIAQHNHYIYIQAESNQPFYIKLDKKIYSSSVSGYLILPKLLDGTYKFLLGFPQKEWPEQSITCKIEDKDLGYLLKNFGDKGWGLFNFQTLDVVMAESQAKTVAVKENKTDEFSNMLADVVNDPTIRQKDPIKEEPKPVIKTAPAEVKEIPKPDSVKEPVIAQPARIKSAITRTINNTNVEGTEMVYIDLSNNVPDTIRVFIPAEKKAAQEKPEKKEKVEEPKPNEGEKVALKKEPVAQQEKPKETKFIEMEFPNPGAKVDTIQKKSAKDKTSQLEKPKEIAQADSKAPVQSKLIEKAAKEKKTDNVVAVEKPKEKELVKQDVKATSLNVICKNFATDEDFLKLRKKMAAEDNDDDMIELAKKAFKTKCFSTGQIKNLGVLFLKDDGKYRFFDEAYTFVSDAENFGSLENQLTDPYYSSRFKAMIRH